MKKMFILAAAAAVSMLFTGCTSVEIVNNPASLNNQAISTTGTPVAHINVQNWGIYLFNIPLFSGATDSIGSIAVMKDTVNAQSVIPVITGEAKKLKATKVYDIASQYNEFGFIFVNRKINVSGNAVK